jgi:predicted HD superfamily hydrolase involved in NAD metabolism
MNPEKEIIAHYLLNHGCPRTWEHSRVVAAQARILAQRFGVDIERAKQAAWLHDISAVIPNSKRLEAAQGFGLEVLPEEAAFPMILHQKLSTTLAPREFGVKDAGVLSAVGCHTTLKAGYAPLDLVLFVADKLAWDQPGEAPYAAALRVGLQSGLEEGARVYLDHLWQRRAELGCIHPWMVAAREKLELRTRI